MDLKSDAFIRRPGDSCRVVPLPTFSSKQEAVACARSLYAVLAEAAGQADRERGVPGYVIKDMVESGLLAIAAPRRFGGSELGFSAMMEVAAEIGAACGSAGWLFGVFAGHYWIVALFPEAAQREVFADRRSLVSSVTRLSGVASAVDGGYRLHEGQGRFSSGIDHADWVIVGNHVQQNEGPPRLAFFLVPKSDVIVLDDWYTFGMRGTGSRSIEVKDVFVPAERMIWVDEMNQGTAPGSALNSAHQFKIPGYVANVLALVGAPLGIARSAVNAFAQMMTTRFADSAERQTAAIARLSEAATKVDAATALVLRDCEAIDGALTSLSGLEGARIRRNAAFAAQQCRQAVNLVFEVGGGSGIYDTAPMQRFWRDANAAAAHFAFSWDVAADSYGRARIELPI